MTRGYLVGYDSNYFYTAEIVETRWSGKLHCGPLNIPLAIPCSFSARGMEMRKNKTWKEEKNAEFEVIS